MRRVLPTLAFVFLSVVCLAETDVLSADKVQVQDSLWDRRLVELNKTLERSLSILSAKEPEKRFERLEGEAKRLRAQLASVIGEKSPLRTHYEQVVQRMSRSFDLFAEGVDRRLLLQCARHLWRLRYWGHTLERDLWQGADATDEDRLERIEQALQREGKQLAERMTDQLGSAWQMHSLQSDAVFGRVVNDHFKEAQKSFEAGDIETGLYRLQLVEGTLTDPFESAGRAIARDRQKE
jgi:hypothetical protein